MTDQTTPTPSLDSLERVTLVSDGGPTGRGKTRVVWLTPEARDRLWQQADHDSAL